MLDVVFVERHGEQTDFRIIFQIDAVHKAGVRFQGRHRAEDVTVQGDDALLRFREDVPRRFLVEGHAVDCVRSPLVLLHFIRQEECHALVFVRQAIVLEAQVGLVINAVQHVRLVRPLPEGLLRHLPRPVH